MNILFESSYFKAQQSGKFVTVKLKTPAHTRGTSFVNGGRYTGIDYLVNHQCVEGKNHKAMGDKMQEMGQEAYHDFICEKLNLPAPKTMLMSTAANMTYCAVKTREYKELEVTALVTAGVQGNAGRAGDPATWHEQDQEWERLHREAGTINIILLINWPLTEAAINRSIMTATEAKTAALLDLAVPSQYSKELATGTGTDQILII